VQTVARFYHRTSAEAADVILVSGFKDCTHRELNIRGVWLSNIPLDSNEGATEGPLLQVVLTLPADKMDAWEVVEEGKPYREWCIPAKVVNRGIISRFAED
jgi:hypothetical protein